jgi:DNA replication protein DnaC
MGPVGVGKTFLAAALGHAACRAGKHVLLRRADALFKDFLQARADHTTSKTLRKYLAPHLLIIDDFALRRLDARQSSDIYEVIIERHKRASTIFTSNRTVEEWIPLFEDPMLAQSALDRLAHNAHQVVLEGESYRKRQAPGARAKPTVKTKTSARRPGRTV